MIKLAFKMQKTKRFLYLNILYFILFLIIFFTLDYLNMAYSQMKIVYGTYLVAINITLNFIMAFLTSLMMNLSSSMVILKGKEAKGSSLGFFSVLFGIMTYGCTTCVIAFFSIIGITLSVIALPLAGLPYKLISLVLIGLGLLIVLRSLKQGSCKIKTYKTK